MTAINRHTGRERLLAQVQLTQRRLSEVAAEIDIYGDEVRLAFVDRLSDLEGRCRALKTKVSSWTEVEIGLSSAVSDLGAAVDAMEADLEATIASVGPLYELAMDRQVRAWRGRLDQLRLQGALGAMEARDDLEDLSDRLDNARSGVLVELQKAIGDGKEVVVDLRNDVEEVLLDVRHAVEKAVAAMSGD